MWYYIVFSTHRRRSGVVPYLTRLQKLDVAYDHEYGVRELDEASSVVMAELTDEQYDAVDNTAGTLRVTALDPFDAPEDPLSGCDELGDPDD